MTTDELHSLLLQGLPYACTKPELVETHISWVIICDSFVYKIKRPVKYSFVDFSTTTKRQYYCEREVQLNKRITDNMYLDVLPVKKILNSFSMKTGKGKVVDYAVRMRKFDRSKQMDVLLQNNQVSDLHIEKLAEKIARFHQITNIIYKRNFLDIQEQFEDLQHERNYLHKHLNRNSAVIIDHALDISKRFIEQHKLHIAGRVANGLFRDCHGDLHSGNIFLFAVPQPFDCIEFNDDLRQIDVLNDIAFLCMDLEAFGKKDLSELFFSTYNDLFPAATTMKDYQLFIYYKSYRANIRVKVNSIRARGAKDEHSRQQALNEANKYLQIMDTYIKKIE